MKVLEGIGFSILFLVAMLLFGGFIGLLPSIAENAVMAILISVGIFMIFKWIRKPKKLEHEKGDE